MVPLQVRSLMSRVEYTAQVTEDLTSILSCMRKHRLSCILVCENDIPTGIVTERDIVNAFYLERTSRQPQDLKSVMTPDPVCVREEMPVNEALAIARGRKIRHIPVTDSQNKLVGVITQSDLTNALLKSLEHATKLEEANEELKSLSLEDPLLKIGNRRSMLAELKVTQASSERHKKPFSISLIDVDYFKRYNDFYGHQVGDQALIDVAKIVSSSLRPGDRVFRYGGEELLVLMSDTDEHAAKSISLRIQQSIFDARIPHAESPLAYLTASIGTATAIHSSWKMCLRQADKALYHAKSNGRNQISSSA